MTELSSLKSLGEELRRARVSQGLSLEDVEAYTKIRKKYLKALEDGNPAEVPGIAYFRGYLKAYSKFLGLDWEATLSKYEAAIPKVEAPSSSFPAPAAHVGPERVKKAVFSAERPYDRPHPPGKKGRVGLPIAQKIALLSLLVLAVTGAWAFHKWWSPDGLAVKPPAQQASTKADEEATGTGGKVEPPPEMQKPPSPPRSEKPPSEPRVKVDKESRESISYKVTGDSIVVKLSVTRDTDRCWIRADADGAGVFEGTLMAGESKVFQAKSALSLRIGRPWAVTLEVNEETLGVAGPYGAPRTVSFTR